MLLQANESQPKIAATNLVLQKNTTTGFFPVSNNGEYNVPASASDAFAQSQQANFGFGHTRKNTLSAGAGGGDIFNTPSGKIPTSLLASPGVIHGLFNGRLSGLKELSSRLEASPQGHLPRGAVEII